MSKSRDLADSANVINFLDNLTEDVNSSLTAKLSTSSNLSDLTDADAAVVNLGLTATTTELNTLDGITATATELNYTDGVTSNIQTQLDTKLASASYTASDVLTKIKTVDGTGSGLDADTLDGNEATAFATAAQGTLADSAVQNLSDLSITATATELNYTDGVTSNIQTQLDTLDTDKADKASPTFTGTPIAPTATAGTNTTQIATTAFVSTAVANVIDSAPGALDTLNELAAALGDDASFSTTVTNSIATKLSSSAVSTYGLTLIDDADAATARTTLGLGTAATTNSTAYATAAQGTLADSAVQNLGDLSITATATELNYTDGVTSNIQTQLDEKIPVQDTVYTLTGTNFDVSNGGIQVKILSENTTFTESLNSGESLVLQIENATTYTVTWPTITWTTSSGNVAPTLTAKDALVLWKVSSTLYGAVIGSYV